MSQKTLKRILDRVLSGGGEFRGRSTTTTRRIGEESTRICRSGALGGAYLVTFGARVRCPSRRRRSAVPARDPLHGPSTVLSRKPWADNPCGGQLQFAEKATRGDHQLVLCLCRSEREAWAGLEQSRPGVRVPRVGFALWIGDPCRWGGVIAPSGRWRRSPATFMIGYVFGRVAQTPAFAEVRGHRPNS